MELNTFQYVSTYKTISHIADGGMGQVFLAEQLGVSGFSKTVGIKTIRRELLDRYYYRDMFIDEAKLVAELIHENIQQVYQLVDMAGSLAIIMEWTHGVTLEDINTRLDERNDYLPPELAVFIVSRVARALAYAHEKRGRDGRPLYLVHRDVSPVNVFVSWGGVVKLADFGIAKAMSARKATRDNEIMGKAPYLVSGPWALSDVKKAGVDYALAKIPGFGSIEGSQARPFAGVNCFYIASKGQNKAFAETFVADAAKDSRFAEAMFASNELPPAQKDLAEKLKAEHADMVTIAEFAASADPMPAIPAMSAVWGPLGQAEANIVKGGSDAGETMRSAGEEIKKAITK